MAGEPHMTELKAIIEAYNQAIREEIESKRECAGCGSTVDGYEELCGECQGEFYEGSDDDMHDSEDEEAAYDKLKSWLSKEEILGWMEDYDLVDETAKIDDMVYDTFIEQYVDHNVEGMDSEQWHNWLADFVADNRAITEGEIFETLGEGLQTPRNKVVFDEPVAKRATATINRLMQKWAQPNRAFYVDSRTIEVDVPAGIEVDIIDGVIDELGGGHYDEINEAPYATMKDGPDKYLFRKDDKQKLVGSYLGDEESYKKGELDVCPRCDGTGHEDVDEVCGLCNKYSNEEELEEALQASPLKTLRQVLQGAGLEAGRGYNDKNVGNRKLRIYTGNFNSSKESEIEQQVQAGMKAAGYEVRGVVASSGGTGNPTDRKGATNTRLPRAGFEAKVFPNVTVWLEGNPIQVRELEETEVGEHGISVTEIEGAEFPRMGYKGARRFALTGLEKLSHQDRQFQVSREMKKILNKKEGPWAFEGDPSGKDTVIIRVPVRENKMDKELRDMQIAAGIRVAEDCDVDAEKNADGECSPFTHADDNVAMVREGEVNTCPDCDGAGHIEGADPLDLADDEWCNTCNGKGQVYSDLTLLDSEFGEDLLLSPKDKPGPEVDEYEEGRGWKDGVDTADYMNPDFDVPDDKDIDEGPDSDDPSAMECPGCGDIAFNKTGSLPNGDDEFECENCHHYGTFAGLAEDPGDGDFAKGYTDDSMIDVGDEEDHEEFDFEDEFEREMGNTNRFESVVEMNELRKLAGMEPVVEEEAEEVVAEEGPEAPGEPSKNYHVGRAFTSSEFEEDKFDDNFEGLASGDLIAYDIADEKAYYAMADILGAELDFGPEDEVLVPAARNDELVIELRGLGFELGKDFEVAGQLQDDLQNGYDDHTYTDGQDYFPKGPTSTPATDLGPSASGWADNPMANKMRSVEKDDVYEGMKLAYRRFRKA